MPPSEWINWRKGTLLSKSLLSPYTALQWGSQLDKQTTGQADPHSPPLAKLLGAVHEPHSHTEGLAKQLQQPLKPEVQKWAKLY